MGKSRASGARKLAFASAILGGVALAGLGFAGFLTPSAPVAQAAAAAQNEPGILRATLPNGLRVILVRNTLAPVVATSVNYLVGSTIRPMAFPAPRMRSNI